MSYGKGGGTETTVQNLSPAQNAMLNTQTGLYQGTMAPAFQQAVGGATNLYNTIAPGVGAAATNQAQTAQQTGAELGTQGSRALQSGISGLENLFSPDYEQKQIAAALAPAQYQYQQNLTGLNAGFGGAGQLGSARAKLAEANLASTNAMNQQTTTANILNQIAQQRAGAASNLGQLGANLLPQTLQAGAAGVTAAMAPQQLFNQYAQVLYGVPGAAYTPSFAGTQATVVGTDKSNVGISI